MPWTRSLERIAQMQERLGPGPWSREDLLGLGWTPRQLDGDVSRGRLVRLRRALYAAGDASPDWTRPTSYAQLVACAPGSVVSHESAALVGGAWLPLDADPRAHLTIGARPLPSDAAVRRHRAALPPDDVEVRDGVPFTTAARTAVDLALGRPLRQALPALDCAVGQLALGPAWCTRAGRAMLASPLGADAERRARAAVLDAASRASGRNGSVLLRVALPWMDARSESPYESWSRAVLIEAGVVPEVVGLEVWGRSGARYFADLAWPSLKVLVEVDGLAKYGDDLRTVRERLAAERHRQNDLEDAGWTVARWTAGEKADAIVARVGRVLAARA